VVGPVLQTRLAAAAAAAADMEATVAALAAAAAADSVALEGAALEVPPKEDGPAP
jgi:hypothetical protein